MVRWHTLVKKIRNEKDKLVHVLHVIICQLLGIFSFMQISASHDYFPKELKVKPNAEKKKKSSVTYNIKIRA